MADSNSSAQPVQAQPVASSSLSVPAASTSTAISSAPVSAPPASASAIKPAVVNPYSTVTTAGTSTTASAYYNTNTSWSTPATWSIGGTGTSAYQFPTQGGMYQQMYSTSTFPQAYPPYQAQRQSTSQTSKSNYYPKTQGKATAKPKLAPAPPLQRTPVPPAPSPPPPELYTHWNQAIKAFLNKIGFKQSIKSFELDLMMLNAQFERTIVPIALGELVQNIQKMEDPASIQQDTLTTRKSESTHAKDPRPHSSINKSISSFMAANRAHNDVSNRNEFLLSLAEKKKLLEESASPDGQISSCARTDAKALDRDDQIKYDIAKNEDGPLKRATNKRKRELEAKMPSSEIGPGLTERLTNIESHLAIHYIPSPPAHMLDRLKCIEDHIVKLELEYPPWAALHFAQPGREWPPPPHSSSIVVPSDMSRPVETTASSAKAKNLGTKS